jgi:hypothetical protein
MAAQARLVSVWSSTSNTDQRTNAKYSADPKSSSVLPAGKTSPLICFAVCAWRAENYSVRKC